MPDIVAKVMRGQREESVHYGSIAVVNSEGKLTHYYGDPEFFTFARSSPKPIQTMCLIQSGAADRYGFSPKQISICCGSHVGSDEHREVVLENLRVADNKPEYLKCGCHVPIFMEMNKQFPTNDEHKDFLRHNCSGKHSGFLAVTKHIGEDVSEYLNPNSKVQQLVLDNIARVYEYPKENIVIGIDGCSAPNFGMPLKQTAIAFQKLAVGRDDTEENSKILLRIKKAMTEYPEMFSGKNRYDLALMQSFPGNIVCKGGAEAIQGIGFSEPSIGIALKIEDGNFRAIYPVCIELLRQLGLIDEITKMKHLEHFYKAEIRNAMKLLTGRIVPEFTLKKA